MQRDAAQDQHAGVEPQQRRHRQRPPVRQPHAHGVGADEQREQRADDGEEDPEPDLRRRRGRWCRARQHRRSRPSSSQGFAVSRCCDSHQPAMPRCTARKTSDDAHGAAPHARPRTRRLVLRDEILRGARARCSRRPSDRRPAGPCPSCHARGGVSRRLPFERRGAPGIAAGRLAAAEAPDEVEQEHQSGPRRRSGPRW